MKKTLSVVFAVIFAFSAFVSAHAALGLISEDKVKGYVADYMGYDESKMSDYSQSKTTHNFLDYYNVTFKYDGVTFKVGIDAAGIVEEYSYNASKIIVPKKESGIISEYDAKGYALKEASVSSSDAVFKSETFRKSGSVPSYSYNFLSKTAEWNVEVNGYTGSIIKSEHNDQNVIIMFFIRLFAKIAALFA